MKKILFLGIVLLWAGTSFAQLTSTPKPYVWIGKGSVQAKNVYFLTLLQNNSGARRMLESDPVISGIARQKVAALRGALKSGKNYQEVIGLLQLSDAEIKTIGDRLVKLLDSENPIGMVLFGQLDPSKAYNQHAGDGQARLRAAWEQDAQDINHILAVYAEGQKPNYPDIDSISFKVNDANYAAKVRQTAQTVLDRSGQSSLFFMPSLTAALVFLDLNGRNDAGNYEPMETGVNAAALDKAFNINWGGFPYSVLVVPGEGPETYDVAISPGGIERCKLAAKAYEDGLAPFILVSGGKVHPYKTKYCEAEEMKKYLMAQLGIPENAIIMEPHARHTTTNLRNAVRLMLKYHFPEGKPGLIVTNKDDNNYIAQMAGRCKAELGYVPYQLGSRVSATELEFFAVPDAFQINPLEPLDP